MASLGVASLFGATGLVLFLVGYRLRRDDRTRPVFAPGLEASQRGGGSQVDDTLEGERELPAARSGLWHEQRHGDGGMDVRDARIPVLIPTKDSPSRAAWAAL
ncbi:MAG: hypothetical protein ABEJ35_04415 [Halobacteriaceae archaeon]